VSRQLSWKSSQGIYSLCRRRESPKDAIEQGNLRIRQAIEATGRSVGLSVGEGV
jgi:hypothetical protein